MENIFKGPLGLPELYICESIEPFTVYVATPLSPCRCM